MKGDNPYMILTAALCWLRNHYDVGDPAIKVDVLRRIDAVLADYPATNIAMLLLHEEYPADARGKKRSRS